MTRRILPVLLAGALTSTIFAVPAQAQTTSPVVINEVESNGDPAGDWIELANTNPNESLDISGWSFLDDNDKHQRIVFPEGTSIESGGYLAVPTEDEAYPDGGFGLGGKDSVRLFDADGKLVDQTTWEGHAASTWGRIPDMTGEFGPTESTRGMKNKTGAEPVETAPWLEGVAIKNVDLGPDFAAEDMSGADFDANGRAWIVNNDEGTLFAVDGDTVAGKWSLKYPDGEGLPDAEGVTVTDDALYVATERNNAEKNTSRPSVLRFDLPTAPGDLTATDEWNLSEFLPSDLGANAGLEAIAAVPGGFAVGVEGTGEVLFVDLTNPDATLLQRYQSPFPGVMALDYDGTQLRVLCDEVCDGASILLEKNAQWEAVSEVQGRPELMGNVANEGYASFKDTCGVRHLWVDDAATDGTSVRTAGVECEEPSQEPVGSSRSDIAALLITILSIIAGFAHFAWVNKLF